MEESYKEVHFDQYCKKCKHKKLDEGEEPCNECLSNPYNEYSHKPVRYEKDNRKSDKENEDIT